MTTKFHIVVVNRHTAAKFRINCSQESHAQFYTDRPDRYNVIARGNGWL